MKNLIVFMCQLFCLALLSFCSKYDGVDFEEQFTQKAIVEAVTRSGENLIFQSDSLVPYEQNDNIGKQIRTAVSDLDLRNEIFDLRELPINIIVKENVRGGRFLTTQGAGKEIVFADYNNNVNQRFYIKILPLSSGIPYLIYSLQTNTPIILGHYSNNPDIRVLFPYTKDEVPWGASWNFLPNSINNTIIIQNNQIMDGGPDYWDLYNITLGANQNKVTFSKYNNSASQEFEFAPIEQFVIQSIEYINDATATFSHKPSKILKDGFSNNGPIEQNYTLQISEEVTETSNFAEKSAMSLNVSTTFSLSVPCLVEGQISTSVTTSVEHTYSESSSVKRAISRSYPVKIPPMYRADLSVTLFDDVIDMNYVATCQGVESGRIIKINGIWHGVSVSQGEATLNLTPLNGRSSAQTFVFDENKETWVPQL
ncbi:MAG: hypothetical protein NC226_05960 [Bacteroides cellulosilyticus]|nr:hypothetical protein [Bacteroides cellulosilyticus]